MKVDAVWMEGKGEKLRKDSEFERCARNFFPHLTCLGIKGGAGFGTPEMNQVTNMCQRGNGWMAFVLQ